MSSTSAGTTIALTASAPATFDAAGYGALTFTEVGGVESIPAFGGVGSVNAFQPLNGPAEKHKGPYNYGSLQVPYAIDGDDAGQTLLDTAGAADNNDLYSFEVTFPSGDKRWFQGRVFGSPETVGSAANVLMATCTIEICTKVIKSV